MNARKRVADRIPPGGTHWRRRIFLLLSLSRLTRARLLNRYNWMISMKGGGFKVTNNEVLYANH